MFISFINTNNAELEAEVSALTQSLATMTDDFASVISRDAEILTLPSGVENVGKNALNNCEALTEITVPASVTNIEKDGFGYVPNLEKITFEGETPPTIEEGAFGLVAKTCEVIVPSGSTAAYSGVTEEIETAANKALITLTLSGGTTEIYYYDDNKIPNNAFQERTDIIGVSIESGITEIGESAFWACSNLSSITIPYSVTTIGSSPWQGAAFTSITIPSSVTECPGYLMWNCSSLVSIDMPLSWSDFPTGAFAGCSSLSSITLGPNTWRLQPVVFGWCTSLSEITCLATTAPHIETEGEGTFLNVATAGTLYYPSGSDYSTWLAALPAGWSGATMTKFEPLTSVTQMAEANYIFCKPNGSGTTAIGISFEDLGPQWFNPEAFSVGDLNVAATYDSSQDKIVYMNNSTHTELTAEQVATVEQYFIITSEKDYGGGVYIKTQITGTLKASQGGWGTNPICGDWTNWYVLK